MAAEEREGRFDESAVRHMAGSERQEAETKMRRLNTSRSERQARMMRVRVSETKRFR